MVVYDTGIPLPHAPSGYIKLWMAVLFKIFGLKSLWNSLSSIEHYTKVDEIILVLLPGLVVNTTDTFLSRLVLD